MSNQVVYSGPSFASLLFIVFLILKLTGVISWSWWYVTMPLWAGIAIALGTLAIILFIVLIALGIGLIINK